MVMSCSWFARPTGWNLGRPSHSARVAGAHLAVTPFDSGDAGTRLVLGIVPRRTVEFAVAPTSHRRAGWFNTNGSGALEPQVHRSSGSETFLGLAAEGHGFDSEEGMGMSPKFHRHGRTPCGA